MLLGSDSPEFYLWQPILQDETPTRFKKQARSSLRHHTVAHAEWYVEVVDTYCKTVMIVSQLRPTLNEIPPDKIADLLAIKKSGAYRTRG